MAGFGENLRREREMRGISLEEISATTKISVRLLEALEREDFGKLPGGIFIRSFIRSYASYLGLDPEQVLAEYQLVAPPEGDEDFSRLGVTAAPVRHKMTAPLVPWVVAILLLGGGYAIFRYSHRPTESTLGYGNPPPAPKNEQANTTTPAPGASLPSNAPASSVVTPAAPRVGSSDATSTALTTGNASTAAAGSSAGVSVTGTQAANPAAPANAASSASLVLQVAATEPSWIDVKADGKTVLEGVLNPNNVRSLSAQNSFDVTTGNAEGTVLTLNGVTLKPLGRRGEVKTVHLTLNDLRGASP